MSRISNTAELVWESAPFVFVPKALCPFCLFDGYIRTRTEAGGDGSVTKKVVCKKCSKRYKIVVELPEPGNGVWPIE
jgi:hypothetical protein